MKTNNDADLTLADFIVLIVVTSVMSLFNYEFGFARFVNKDEREESVNIAWVGRSV